MTERYSELGGQPSAQPLPVAPKRIGRAPQWDGCQHTDDPNGFLMDADGNLTGICPCWTEKASEGSQ